MVFYDHISPHISRLTSTSLINTKGTNNTHTNGGSKTGHPKAPGSLTVAQNGSAKGVPTSCHSGSASARCRAQLLESILFTSYIIVALFFFFLSNHPMVKGLTFLGHQEQSQLQV